MEIGKNRADKVFSKSVPVFGSFDKKRKVFCRFDSYECFRNLCCHSRFRVPFRCIRFVEIPHFLFTYPTVKVDLQFRSG